jgi:hypothetical protein
MSSITELPPNVLDLIFEQLNSKSLRSASLAIAAWSQAYKRRCCETFSLDLSSDKLDNKIALLERWERLDLLDHVQQITINDSGERSRRRPGSAAGFIRSMVAEAGRVKGRFVECVAKG